MKTLRLLLSLSLILSGNLVKAQTDVQAQPLSELLAYPMSSAPATVISLADSRISSELNALITALPVNVGETVAAGSTLVSLNCSDYQLRTAELKARLASVSARAAFARKQHQRGQSLKRQKTLARELTEQREAEFLALQAEQQAAQAALRHSQHNQQKCTIKSPFKAVVIARFASVGELAAPGTPLLRIMALDALEVSAAILPQDAERLTAATQPVFEIQGQQFPLQLRVISPVIDSTTRTREARLQFAGRQVLPGASGRLLWSQGASIAPDYLSRREGVLGVFVATEQQARFHILTGAQEGQPAQIEGNLNPDSLLITNGFLNLQDGDAIRIVPQS